jgi:hypothetical protein
MEIRENSSWLASQWPLSCGYTDGSTPAASREFFYIGGKYLVRERGYAGQMYVSPRPSTLPESIRWCSSTAPRRQPQLDGRQMGGLAGLTTPGQGYVVCLVDQPARGFCLASGVNGDVGFCCLGNRAAIHNPEIYIFGLRPKAYPMARKSDKKGRRRIRLSTHSWRLKWKG